MIQSLFLMISVGLSENPRQIQYPHIICNSWGSFGLVLDLPLWSLGAEVGASTDFHLKSGKEVKNIILRK